MIEVSNAWKEAHKQSLLPESFVEISMDVVDTDVSASVYGYGVYSESNSTDVVNADKRTNNEPYAWLEHNLWVLDGSRGIAPNKEATGTNTRLITDVGCIVEFALRSPGKEVPGITITWSSQYDEYATDFTVEIFKRDGEAGLIRILEKTVTNNTNLVSFVDMPSSEYHLVKITVNEWSLPDHRCRIDSVKFGQILVFDKNQIINYTHDMSGSPLGTEVTRNLIEFEVDNVDGRWDLLNPNGIAKYLCEQQRISVHYGLQTNSNVEWVQAGVFFLSEWKTSPNGLTATFTAGDVIEFFQNTNYSRVSQTGTVTSEISAYKTKDDVWPGENPVATIPGGASVEVYEMSVQYTTGYGDDPEDPGWMRYRTEYGWVNADYVTLTTQLLIDDLPRSIAKLPKGISVSYVQGYISTAYAPVSLGTMSVSEFIQKCVASSGYTFWQRANGTLVMRSPATQLSDYVISTNVSYAYPKIELSRPLKEVEIVYHYRHHPDTKSKIYPVADTGERITVDAPYVWWDLKQHQENLANKYINWWNKRGIISGEFRADPRLELFDAVAVESEYGVIAPVMITQLTYTYNGSFRATYTGKVMDDTIVANIDEDEVIEEVVEGV